MDDAVDNPEFKYDETQLRAINACRMFHGLVFPSELLHYDEKSFNQKYLTSKFCQRNNIQHQSWPSQPVPTDAQWIVWRKFIRKHYLDDDEDKW